MSVMVSARVTEECARLLGDLSESTGVSKSNLIEEALRSHLGMPAVAPKRRGPPRDARKRPVAKEGAGTVDFATWLRGRTGLPRALCESKVRRGQVTVDGRVWTEPRVPKDLLSAVVFDGDAL